jgi:ATP-dependent helicase HepA
VGLGKTIEAGIILRQFLIDHRLGRVLVLVPPHLREQWRTELEDKFAAFDAPERVLLLGTDEWERAPVMEGIDLAIVDEAHHVAELVGAPDPSGRERFKLYQRLARSTARLLLLSATPALHNEAAFLALLHLLEPEVYRLDDVNLLRSRLDARQEVGRFLVSFNESSPAFSLRRGLARLTELVPDDPHLSGLAGGLREMLEAEAGPEARARLVREIRSHVGDRYRLHRRLLRTRRETVGEGVTPVRQATGPGSSKPVEEYDLGQVSTYQHELLEEWREAAFVEWSRAEAGGDTGSVALLPETLIALLDAVAAGGSVLAAAVSCRLGVDHAEGLHDLGADAVHALCTAPRFGGEADLLRKLAETAATDERSELLLETLRGFGPRRGKPADAPGRKVLVFTTFRMVRQRLAARLTEAFGAEAVASYGAESGALEADAQVRRFRDSAECWILLCDRSGEEGRNLQCADCLVHFDLPFSPNRVEQRIGRLDRIGRDREVQSRVFLGPEVDDSAYAAWFAILDEGFGVFRASIAGLQFFIDASLPGLVHTLFRGGAQGLMHAMPRVREGITAERARLAEQYALDEIDILDRGAPEYYGELVAHDADADRFRVAFDGWVCQGLRIDQRSPSNIPGAIVYRPASGSLVPHDLLLERFGLDVISRPGTFRRDHAVESPGLTLYRLGEPLVEALDEYLQWDDRGRAFAVWRVDPRLSPTPGAEWSYFRFDYVVEADTRPAEAVLKALAWPHAGPAALRRRGDLLLAPAVETVFVRADGGEAADPLHLRILNRPYRKREEGGLDYSLTKERLRALDLVVDRAFWPDLCAEARSGGERTLRERPKLRERLAGAATRAEATLGERVAGMRRRTDTAEGTGERTVLATEAEMEARIADALISGVRAPRLRLDSVGFCVLSGRDPFQ